MEQRERVAMSFSDQIADSVTALSGSMACVAFNAAWFAAWIGLHLIGVFDFDPYPFGLLTMIVSLEAIFFSLFVLISQNRQAVISEKRARLDLQVNLIAEREVTKLIGMVERMQKHLGIVSGEDPEIEHMRRPTHIRDLADKMDAVEAETDPKLERGPHSAADTEA